MNLPSTRIDALNVGLKVYYTGNPCIHGHISPRRTANNGCVECLRMNATAWKKENPDRHRLSRTASWRRNAEKNKAKKREYTAKNKKIVLLGLAKRRARLRGIEFSICELDITWPTHCPALGIEIDYAVRGQHQPNSPTLDRTDNLKGYIPGNVRVISFRANELKSNGTPQELRLVSEYVARECGI